MGVRGSVPDLEAPAFEPLRGLRVLVTDGETRAALAATRALGARGCLVHVASTSGCSLAGASRFAAADHAVGDVRLEPKSWAERVEGLVEAKEIDALLPVSEMSHGNLYRFGLSDRASVACPPREAYEAAVDKKTLIERAAGLGVEVPLTAFVEDPARLSDLPEGLRFPAVLKPRRSCFFQAGRWQSGVAILVRDGEGLDRARRDPGLAGGTLVQEYVPGHGEAVFLLAERGRALVRFAYRRIREKPPTGGQSTLRESILPDPVLLDASEKLLGELAYTGAAMCEFRRRPDGRAPLLEINPRLWGSVQLAIDAGVDVPTLLLAQRLGLALPKVAPRHGVRTRWLLGDVDHLLISLRRAELRRERGVRMTRLVADFVASFFDGSRSEVLRPDDWRPFLRELRAWIRE